MDAHVIAEQCELSGVDYSQLTSLEWIVLDLSDGKRSFGDILSLVPVNAAELTAAYTHLHQLRLLRWEGAKPESNTPRSRVLDLMPDDMEDIRAGRRLTLANDQSSAGKTQLNWMPNRMPEDSGVNRLSQPARLASSAEIRTVTPAPGACACTPRDINDTVCSQYLPRRLFADFRSFEPKLLDTSLDLAPEVQMFTEYIYERLSGMSAADLLGLEENEITRVQVKQAYIMRTRQFHPDRYFRKNIGVFAPRIAAIFKAVTGAFTSLQAKAR